MVFVIGEAGAGNLAWPARLQLMAAASGMEVLVGRAISRLSPVPVTHTTSLLHHGSASPPALNDGLRLAFAIAIAFPALGLLASLRLGRTTATTWMGRHRRPIRSC